MILPKTRRYTVLLAAMAGLLVSACTTLPAAPPAADSPAAIVATYTEAFNARDLDGMEAMLHPEFEWYSVDRHGANIVSWDRAQLLAQMEDYFDDEAVVTSEMTGWATSGRFVSAKETARWTNSDGVEQAQSAIVVYQLTPDERLRRVWYYPAVEAE